jgi:hypothetical protein
LTLTHQSSIVSEPVLLSTSGTTSGTTRAITRCGASAALHGNTSAAGTRWVSGHLWVLFKALRWHPNPALNTVLSECDDSMSPTEGSLWICRYTRLVAAQHTSYLAHSYIHYSRCDAAGAQRLLNATPPLTGTLRLPAADRQRLDRLPVQQPKATVAPATDARRASAWRQHTCHTAAQVSGQYQGVLRQGEAAKPSRTVSQPPSEAPE